MDAGKRAAAPWIAPRGTEAQQSSTFFLNVLRSEERTRVQGEDIVAGISGFRALGFDVFEERAGRDASHPPRTQMHTT